MQAVLVTGQLCSLVGVCDLLFTLRPVRRRKSLQRLGNGSPHVSWGDFAHFAQYSVQLTWFVSPRFTRLFRSLYGYGDRHKASSDASVLPAAAGDFLLGVLSPATPTIGVKDHVQAAALFAPGRFLFMRSARFIFAACRCRRAWVPPIIGQCTSPLIGVPLCFYQGNAIDTVWTNVWPPMGHVAFSHNLFRSTTFIRR